MSEDISAIITGHREGRICVASLRSFRRTVEYARNNGLKVQQIFVLDNANELTKSLFANFAGNDNLLIETNYGDQGAARNEAIAKSNGNYIAFLDGDDIWQIEWLVMAYIFLQNTNPVFQVAHPEFNYFFEEQASIFCQRDQNSPGFDVDAFRHINFWDALSFCHRSILERFPYAKREMDLGWAYEDWRWNIETLLSGVVHRIVPDTVIFKRRRKMSQTIKASTSKARFRKLSFLSYSHPVYSI